MHCRSTYYRMLLLALVAAASASTGMPAVRGAISMGGYSRVPLYFEPNAGQFDSQVRYVARGSGYSLFLTDAGAVMVLRRGGAISEQAVVRMKLAGSRPPAQWVASEKQEGISNYFIGNNPKEWHTDIPNFGRVEAREVYPGVDLICYGNRRQLEYDLAVAPGADPGQIQLVWDGADSLRLNAEGDLVVSTRLGEVVQKRPRVYQDTGGKRTEIASRYALAENNRVRFALARYDRARPLVIDPVVLTYSTFLGGSGTDSGAGIAVDSAGSAYVTGTTSSANFPTQSGYQTARGAGNDVFVTKFTAAGTALVYSSYLGGNAQDDGAAIAVDAAGAAYVTGVTGSTNFPVVSAYQPALKGTGGNAFVTKLAPAGNALTYSTYLGGGGDYATGIALDTTGAYVVGTTRSTNFPTVSAYQSSLKGTDNIFVSKLSPAGNTLIYSTYLGGSTFNFSTGIAVDGAGSAYVTGQTYASNFPTQSPYQSALKGTYNAFVTKLAVAGNALVYSTYLGGSGSDSGNGIAVDAAGSAYVTGQTTSSNFPTQAAYQASLAGVGNAFVTKLAPAGNTLAYSTYLGGNGSDLGYGIAVDGAGSAYVAGQTNSTNFPTLQAHQTVNNGGESIFVSKLAPAGNALFYSTYLGGSVSDSGLAIAVDGAGSTYVTGTTVSTDFPTHTPFQSTLKGSQNAFVFKLGAYSPLLSITKSHIGNFTPGESNATYAATVSNAAAAPATIGTVTVTEAVPSGLTLVSMSGSAWTCSGNTCSRSDPLTGGTSYSSITITVNVASNASSPQVNSVTVSGGGAEPATAADSTIIGSAYSPCDVNQDGITNVSDVQSIINEALGTASAKNDLNGDGVVNVADVQIVVNAALGSGCA